MPSMVCRHPLDQQNTRLLQLLPGLQVFARNLMGASDPTPCYGTNLLRCQSLPAVAAAAAAA